MTAKREADAAFAPFAALCRHHPQAAAALAFSRDHAGDVRPELLLWFIARDDRYRVIVLEFAALRVILNATRYRIRENIDAYAYATIDALERVRERKCEPARTRARQCAFALRTSDRCATLPSARCCWGFESDFVAISTPATFGISQHLHLGKLRVMEPQQINDALVWIDSRLRKLSSTPRPDRSDLVEQVVERARELQRDAGRGIESLSARAPKAFGRSLIRTARI